MFVLWGCSSRVCQGCNCATIQLWAPAVRDRRWKYMHVQKPTNSSGTTLCLHDERGRRTRRLLACARTSALRYQVRRGLHRTQTECLRRKLLKHRFDSVIYSTFELIAFWLNANSCASTFSPGRAPHQAESWVQPSTMCRQRMGCLKPANMSETLSYVYAVLCCHGQVLCIKAQNWAQLGFR